MALPSLPERQRIAAGNVHSLAIKTDGRLWAWGRTGLASSATAPPRIAGARSGFWGLVPSRPRPPRPRTSPPRPSPRRGSG
ncbi:RCC1-like domain-containing protein [Thiocystis minor]|uniref:RCC1-like domain-containing protein n=1 Tax=Thiocystis minor TaxID=61597 RepID=UPI003B82E9E6